MLLLFVFKINNINCFRLGHLEESTLHKWKYLYYGKRHIHFGEVIKFYTTYSSEINFKISNYRYLGQSEFLRNRYWGHYNFCLNSPLQPYKDLLVNIMLTTDQLNLLSEVNPNVIKLSDVGFLSDKIQYNTNYVIVLDSDIIVEQFNQYEKNKIKIDKYIIENRENILKNINSTESAGTKSAGIESLDGVG